jgi:hypothetical protein
MNNCRAQKTLLIQHIPPSAPLPSWQLPYANSTGLGWHKSLHMSSKAEHWK